MEDWANLMKNQNIQAPWLIFPMSPIEEMSINHYTCPLTPTRYGLLNFRDPNVHVLELPNLIHSPCWCVGVYKTWLLICCEDYSILLLNPFNGTQIPLPSKRICINSVTKFVVSDDFLVLAIYGADRSLVYCKPGDEKWKVIKDGCYPYSDLVYYDGDFYALDDNKGVVEVVFSGSSPPKLQVIKFPEEDSERNYYRRTNEMCLVGSFGKLLLVQRIREYETNQTFSFLVYEFDSREWVRVSSLGNCALFVGLNYSCALQADLHGCRENCIYFVDHHSFKPAVFHNIGAFELQDTSIEYLAYGRGMLDIGTFFFAGHGAWITPALS